MAAQLDQAALEPAAQEPRRSPAKDRYLTDLLDLALDAMSRTATASKQDAAVAVVAAARATNRYLDLTDAKVRPADRATLATLAPFLADQAGLAGDRAIEPRSVAWRLDVLGFAMTADVDRPPTAHEGAAKRVALAAMTRAGAALDEALATAGGGRDAEVEAYARAASLATWDVVAAADAAMLMAAESPQTAITGLGKAITLLEAKLDQIDAFIRASHADHAPFGILFAHERRLLESVGRTPPERAVGLQADASAVTGSLVDQAAGKGRAAAVVDSPGEAVRHIEGQIDAYFDGMRRGFDDAADRITENVPRPAESGWSALIDFVIDAALDFATDQMWDRVKAAAEKVGERKELRGLIGEAGVALGKKVTTRGGAAQEPNGPDGLRLDFKLRLRRAMDEAKLQFQLGFADQSSQLEALDLTTLQEIGTRLASQKLGPLGEHTMRIETLTQWINLRAMIHHGNPDGTGVVVPDMWNSGLRMGGSLELDVIVPPGNPSGPVQVANARLVGVEAGVAKAIGESLKADATGNGADGLPAAKLAELGITKVFRVGHVATFRDKLVLVKTGNGPVAINHMGQFDRALLAARALGKSYGDGDGYMEDRELDAVAQDRIDDAAAGIIKAIDHEVRRNGLAVGRIDFWEPS